MDREYYSPIGSYLTPEQIRHEEESSWKIFEKYRMSNTGILGTFIGVGTFLALKGRGPLAKVLVPTLTGGLASIARADYIYKVSVFFKWSLSS